MDPRKEHKTLSYLSVLTVTCSRIWTTSAVCGSRGVEPGSLLRRTSLQIPIEETISPSQRCLVCYDGKFRASRGLYRRAIRVGVGVEAGDAEVNTIYSIMKYSL